MKTRAVMAAWAAVLVSCLGACGLLAQGALSLSTVPPVTLTNGQNGVVFDITTGSTPLKIWRVGCGSSSTGTHQIEVWYRPVGGMSSVYPPTASGDFLTTGWVLAGSAATVIPNTTTVVQIPLDLNISMPANTTWGWAVRGVGVSVRYMTIPGSLTAPFEVSNPDMTINFHGAGGSAVTSPAPGQLGFTPSIFARGFPGTVWYDYDQLPGQHVALDSIRVNNNQGLHLGNNTIQAVIKNQGTTAMDSVPVTLEYSTDGGITWPVSQTFTYPTWAPLSNQLATFSTQWNVPAVAARNLKVRINPAIGTGAALGELDFIPDVDIDAVTINPDPPVLNTPLTIGATLKNNGGWNLSGVPLSMRWTRDGVNYTSETLSPTTFGPNGTANVTFAGTSILFAAGNHTYTVEISPQLNGDPDAADTLSRTFENIGWQYHEFGTGSLTATLGPVLYRSSSATTSAAVNIYQFYYEASMLTGIQPGSALTSIQFFKTNQHHTQPGKGHIMRVWLQNTTANTLATGAQYQNFHVGSTLVYESTNWALPIDTGWITIGPFNQNLPFLYTGDNLLFSVEWNMIGDTPPVTIPGPDAATSPSWRYDSITAVTNSARYVNSTTNPVSPTLALTQNGQNSATRKPHARFYFEPPVATDLDVDEITFGTGNDVSPGIGSNVVNVTIRSMGTQAYTGSFSLRYSTDGGTSWTTPQSFTASGLSQTSATQTVTLSTPWVIPVVGAESIRVQISPAVSGDPDFVDQLIGSYIPDADVVDAVFGPLPLQLQGNIVSVTIKNDGTFSLNGVPLSLRYSLDGSNWVTESFTPSTLASNGDTQSFPFTQTVALQPGVVTLYADISPQLPTDPDLSDSLAVTMTVMAGLIPREILANATTGNGTSTGMPFMLSSSYNIQRSTAVYLASELAEAGLLPGDTIAGISIMTANSTTQLTAPYENFRVGMMHTSAVLVDTNQATFPANGDYTEVFGPHTFSPQEISQQATYIDMPFHTGFVWNGTDNIRVNLQHYNQPAITGGSRGITTSTVVGARITRSYHTSTTGYPHDPPTNLFTTSNVVPKIRLFTPVPPDYDLDIKSVGFGPLQRLAPSLGSSSVSVTIENRGLLGHSGSLSLRFSTDGGTNWVTESFPATGLGPVGATQSFAFTQPWVISSLGSYNFIAEISPQIPGDPDASDQYALLVQPDLDVTAVGIDANRRNQPVSVVATIQNNGSFNMNGESISLRYQVDSGPWTTETFTITSLAEPSDTQVFTFAPVVLFPLAGNYSVTVEVFPQVTGDPDTSDSFTAQITDIGSPVVELKATDFPGTSVTTNTFPSGMTGANSSFTTIWTPQQLQGVSGKLVEFGWMYAGAGTRTFANKKIWMGESTQISPVSFEPYMDRFVAPPVLVYDGPFTFTSTGADTYQRFALTTPFEYSGVNNLMVYLQLTTPTGTTFSHRVFTGGGVPNFRAYLTTAHGPAPSTGTSNHAVGASFKFEGPADYNANIKSVSVNSDGMVAVGPNTVTVEIVNKGLFSLNGPISLEFSDDNTIWTPATVNATQLNVTNSSQTFTLAAPWNIAAMGAKTLQVRFATQVPGDPDSPSEDTVSLSFTPDLDILAGTQSPAGIPRIGINTPRIRLQNNGQFRLSGQQVTLSYQIDANPPVTQQFTLAGLDANGATQLVEFSTPWTLAAQGPVVITYDITTPLAGDPDLSETFTNSFANAGLLEVEIVPPGSSLTSLTHSTGGYPLNIYYHDQRMQSLILASDLLASGFRSNAPVTAIFLRPALVPVNSGSETPIDIENFRIRIQTTSLTEAPSSFLTTGWTDIYGPTTIPLASLTAGNWVQFPLLFPLPWNGTDNLLIDFTTDGVSWYSSGGAPYLRNVGSPRSRIGYADSAVATPYPFDAIANQSNVSYIPQMKLAFTLGPDTDLDIESVSLNGGAGAVVGNNSVSVRIRNNGLLSHTGLPINLQYSTDGTNWTSETFTGTALSESFAENFTFTAPLVRSDASGFTLQVRINAQPVGDPDTTDVTSLVIAPRDVDLVQLALNPASPAPGSNAIGFTLTNNGGFDLSALSLNVEYVLRSGTQPAGAPVSHSFSLAPVGAPGSSANFTFPGSWNANDRWLYSIMVQVPNNLTGDPDGAESISQSFGINLPWREIGVGTLSGTGTPLSRTSATTTSHYSVQKQIYPAEWVNLPQGALITDVQFYKASSSGTVADQAHLDLWLGNSVQSGFEGTQQYQSLWPNMTRVTSSTSFGFPTVAGWMSFGPFNTGETFVYDGSNLAIGVDANFANFAPEFAASPTTGSFSWRYDTWGRALSTGVGYVGSVAPDPISSVFTTNNSGNQRLPQIRIQYFVEAPQVLTRSLPPAEAGRFFGQQLEAEGGLGVYTWELAPASNPLPSGMAISIGGLLGGTPSIADMGVHNITVRVNDGSTTHDRDLQLEVVGFHDDFSVNRGWNSPGTLWTRGNPASNSSVKVNRDASLSGTGFVAGTNPAGNAPANMTDYEYWVSPMIDLSTLAAAKLSWKEYTYVINPVSRIVEATTDGTTWTRLRDATFPTSSQVGYRSWNPLSLDLSAFSGSQTFQLRFGYKYEGTSTSYAGWWIDDVTIRGENAGTPYFTSPSNLGVIGSNQMQIQPGSLSVNAGGFASGPVIYSVTGGALPAGMNLSASTGELSGNPSATGNFNFTVTASAGAESVSREFSLAVDAGSNTLWMDDFSNSRGWSYSGDWERGPTIGYDAEIDEPFADTTGRGDNHLAGTVIGGSSMGSATNPVMYLTSPRLDLTLVAPVVLTWQEWSEWSTPVSRNVEVSSDDGQTWTTVLTQNFSTTSSSYQAWVQNSVTIHYQVGNQPLSRIRFAAQYTGTTTSYAGWYIDDVRITGAYTLPPTISTTTLPAGQEEAAYTTTLVSTGGLGIPAWSVDPFSAHQLPAGLTLDPNTGEIAGTPVGQGTSWGLYNITFVMNDGVFPAISQTLALDVSLKPLTIPTIGLPTGMEESPYSFTIAGDGGLAPSFRTWSIAATSIDPLPSGLSINPSTGEISGTPAGSGGSFGTHSIQVAVTDGVLSAQKTFVLVIDLIPLTITTTALANAVQTTPYLQPLAATGGTGQWAFSLDATSGPLPAGLAFSGDGRAIQGTPDFGTIGSYPLVLSASDGFLTTTAPLSITVDVRQLEILTVALPVVTEGVPYSVNIEADGGTRNLALSITDGVLPGGLTLSPSGLLSGTTAINNQSAGSYPITVQLIDTVDGLMVPAIRQYVVTVQLSPVVITTASLPNGQEESAYSAQLAATGGTGTFTWGVSASSSDQLPPGLTINPTTGAITGTPQGRGASAGVRTITIEANDGIQAPTAQVFSLTINLRPLAITTSSIAHAMEDAAYSVTLAGQGGGAVWTWSVATGSVAQIPAGLTLNPSTGEISGTPAPNNGSAGIYQITFQLSDGTLTPATRMIVLTVDLQPFVFQAITLPPTVETEAYSQQLVVTGGTGTYTFSVISGTMPPGIALNSSTGQIGGAANANSANDYTFTVRVNDGVNSPLQRTLSINVFVPGLTIVTTALDPALEETPYSFQIVGVGGGVSAQYQWSLDATSVDQLPQGLTLNASTGLISGSPAGPGISHGSYNLTIRLWDGNLVPTTQQMTLTVSMRPLSISSAALPMGTVGSNYSASTGVQGGNGNYLITLAAGSGSLPPGLGLSSTTGEIFGAPAIDASNPYSASGVASYGFNVRASDGTSVVTQAYTIEVQIQPLAITTSSLPNGTEGNAYSASLAGTGGTGSYTWSVAAGSSAQLPAGLSLSAGGAITGTLAIDGQSYGTRSITFQLNNGGLAAATRTISISVALRPVSISAGALAQATVGVAYSHQLAASGGTGSFSWSIAAGSPAQLPTGLSLSASGLISGTAAFGTQGIRSLTFAVSDGVQASVTASRSLTVIPAPLSIDTLALAAGTEGTPYTATLTASGGTGAYVWSIAPGSGGLPTGLSLGANGAITGTPAINGQSYGNRNITFRLSDTSLTPADKQLSLEIALRPLVITTSSLAAATVGTAYSVQLAATGGTGSFTWSIAPASAGQLPQGVTLNANTGQITGTAATGTHGTFAISFRVNDGVQNPVDATISLTVNPAAITVTTSLLPNGQEGQSYSQQLAAAGGVGGYVWALSPTSTPLPAGLSISAAGVISGTPTTGGLSQGVYTISVQVTDTANASTSKNLSLTIGLPAISITTQTLAAGTEGTAYSATLAATGGTGNYTWSLTTASQTLPTGLNLSPSGVISGTPAIGGQSHGTRNLIVQVSDGVLPAVTKPLSITIALQPLVVSTATLPNGTEGTAYSATLTATGGTGSYTWSVGPASSLPQGLSLSTAGNITGTPAINGASFGTSTVSIAVNDTVTTTIVSRTITIALSSVTITTASLPNGTEGSPYSATLAASGGTGTFTWALSATSPALPQGLSITTAGSIIGIPATGGASAGSVAIVVQANDGQQTPVTKTLGITIALQAISISTTTIPNGQEGAAYSTQLVATGGTGVFTWALATGSNALPAGLTIGAATGMITGTPAGSGASAGSYAVTVQASSGNATPATRLLSFTIALQPLVITTATLPNGTEGSAYSAQLAATGGTSSRTWSLASGSPALPNGLTLNPTSGAISGTPLGGGQSHGTRSLLIQVSSGGLPAVTRSLSITIALTPVSITTTSLPNGTEGTSYSTSLSANGGAAAYSWSLSSGTLPPGLNISTGGIISGLPAINGQSFGTRNFTVAVTDGFQAPVTAQLSITVALRPVVITPTNLPAGNEGSPYQAVLSATGGTGSFTWSISGAAGLPSGLSLSTGGVISGTPAIGGASAGTYPITFAVSDGQQAPVTTQLQIVIALVPLSISTTTLPNGTEGTAYSAALSAVGGTGSYTWSLAAGSTSLPNGLSLSGSGQITGNPATGGLSAGSYSITVQVSSGSATPATRQLSFTIALRAVQVTATTLPVAVIGRPYSATVSATGGSGSYSFSASNLPNGLSMSASGVISGNAGVGTDGVRTIQVTATSGTAAPASLALSLRVVRAPAFTLVQLVGGVEGQAYSQTFNPIAGSGGTPVLSLATGSLLPMGLSISGLTIAGTPAVGTEGTHTFTLVVSDTYSSSQRGFTMVIQRPVNNPPMVTVNAGVTISGGEFNSTTGMVNFSLTGNATDVESDPFTLLWTQVGGPVNGNLTIVTPSAAVSQISVAGSAIAAGSYIFRLTATENVSGLSGNAQLQVLVTSPTVVPPAAHAGVPQTVVAGTSVQLSGAESSDPDDSAPNALTYAWTVVSSPATVTLSSNTAVRPSFTPTVAGQYVFRLVVTDRMALVSNPATVTVTVTPLPGTGVSSRAQISVSHTDTDSSGSINPSEAVTLTAGVQTTATNVSPVWSWTQTNGPANVAIANPAAGIQTVSFTQPGTYEFKLAVSIGGNQGIPATVSVTVTPVGTMPPVAVASIDPEDDPDSNMTILFIPGVGVDGQASNPAINLRSTGSSEGASISYLWRQVAGPTAQISGITSPTLTVVPTLSRVYSFELQVTDANNVSAVSIVTLAVDTFDPVLNPTGNSVPVASASSSTGSNHLIIGTGTQASLLGSASDNNDTSGFIFLWEQVSGPPVALNLTNPQNPTFVPPVPGVYVFNLYVDDGMDISLPSTITVNATDAGPGPSLLKARSGCALDSNNNAPVGVAALILLSLLAVARRRRRQA